jgi:low temperature requirement protein LtrA
MAGVIAGGLLLIFALWWIYFDHPAQHFLAAGYSPFVWGYGHLAIFAATAAIGAGLGIAIDQASGAHGHLPAAVADAAIAVPVAVFLLGVWALVVLPLGTGRVPAIAFPVAAVLILAAIGSGWAVLVAGIVAAALIATLILAAPRSASA